MAGALNDYHTQIVMNTNRMNAIANYPTNSSGQPADYATVASNDMDELVGIFYTNHAAAMRLAKNNSIFHGAVVSRDEAIGFAGSLKFNYDSRIHSRYNKNPNIFIDLGPPIAVLSWSDFTELSPDPPTSDHHSSRSIGAGSGGFHALPPPATN